VDGSTPGGNGRFRTRMRAVLVDVSPLRSDPGFRQLWLGQVGSGLGRETARVLLPLHVYLITESAFMLGVVALAQLIPSLLFSLSGGALADAFDRRALMIWAQVGQALTTLVLLGASLLPEPPVAIIVGCAAIISTLFTVEHPSRTSAVPRLVPRERLSSAIALQSLNFQVSALVGPALAGILIAFVDVSAAYGLQALAYVVGAAATTRMPKLPSSATVTRAGVAAVVEGLRFLRGQKVITAAIALDLNAMIFGLPIAVFPVLAIEVFGVGPAEVGFLAAARGAGAFLAAFVSGWVRSIRRTGLAVINAVAAYSIITIVLGVGGIPYVVALVLVGLAGAADLLSAVLRNTIIQGVTTDELRGRMSAVHGLATQSGPRLGDIRAATMTEWFGASGAVAIGGVIALAGCGLLARAFPAFRRYRHDDH